MSLNLRSFLQNGLRGLDINCTRLDHTSRTPPTTATPTRKTQLHGDMSRTRATQSQQSHSAAAPLVDTSTLCGAVVTGDLKLVEQLVLSGESVDQRSPDGFVPLCIAAFWGYADIVKFLLENGADINATTRGTGMTACHCAAFQGHGKVLMYLTQHSPDLTIKDSMGRTAADFASAIDSVWPFFAALGCKRTGKEDLIRMSIIQKATSHEGEMSTTRESARLSRFSRPGSSYVLAMQSLDRSGPPAKMSSALAYGDVLCEDPNEA